MKQADIKTGESYLSHKTDVQHRKHMEGTVVTVVGKKGGGKKINYHGGIIPTGCGKKPVRYKLSNGEYCNAGELKTLK